MNVNPSGVPFDRDSAIVEQLANDTRSANPDRVTAAKQAVWFLALSSLFWGASRFGAVVLVWTIRPAAAVVAALWLFFGYTKTVAHHKRRAWSATTVRRRRYHRTADELVFTATCCAVAVLGIFTGYVVAVFVLWTVVFEVLGRYVARRLGATTVVDNQHRSTSCARTTTR